MKKLSALFLSNLICFSLFASDGTQSRTPILFNLQGNISTISLGSSSFSEFGLEPTVGFFPFKQLSFHGSYYAVAKPDGSSNLNGLGFSLRYYFLSPGAEVNLGSLGTTLISTPGIVPYAGLEFLERDLKASSTNLSFTGFSMTLGGDWRFHHKWFANAEFSYAALKSSLSSARVQDLKITTIGLSLGVSI